MDSLGTAILSLAAVGAACTTALGLTSEARPGLLPAAHRALHATSLLLLAALGCLTYAFLAHDFSLRYVADYSDRATALTYLIAGVWAGQAGSLVLWTAAVSGACSLLLVRRYRSRRPARGDGWLAGLSGLVVLAFLVIVVLYSNPFEPMMRSRAANGVGLNGLLRNPLMALHPPVLFAGFALTAAPALLATRALLRGEGGSTWVREARPYALAAWALLAAGNVLGMLWAYEELGWGGYWGWDPVENASLLPWISSTAYLHAAAVCERRGMLPRTTAALAFATLILPLFGTYLTRSGVVASQHAFASSPAASAFLLFLGVLAAGCAALLAWRWGSAGRGAAHIESAISREAGAVLTAILLGVMIAAMTAATLAPLWGRAFAGGAIEIEPEGYARFMGPLGLVLLFLTAVCPLLAYRRTPGRRVLAVFLAPGVAAAAVLVAVALAGRAAGLGLFANDRFHGFALGAFPLATFVVVAALGDLVRGVLARARATGESPIAAARWFAQAGRRRAGSVVVHVGAALMFAGFAGASYQQDVQGTLAPAAAAGAAAPSLAVGDYRLTYLGAQGVQNPEYEETRALVRVDTPDGEAHLATPSLRHYRSGSIKDTAEVAILTGLAEDLYVEVRGFLGGLPGAALATLRAHVNPLTSLVWIGSLALMAGTLVAAWPARRPGLAATGDAAPRRGRSFALIVGLATALTAFLEGAPRGALLAAGAVLLAALWTGGAAVLAATNPGAGRPGTIDRDPDSERVQDADRVRDEIAMEKMMDRWEDA